MGFFAGFGAIFCALVWVWGSALVIHFLGNEWSSAWYYFPLTLTMLLGTVGAAFAGALAGLFIGERLGAGEI